MKGLIVTLFVAVTVNHFYVVDAGYAPRIIGGKDATKGQFPHMVSLQFRAGTNNCGAAIISPTWIVTAAHCVTGINKITVVAGLLRLSDNNEDVQQITSAEIISHPDWPTKRADIALIKLSHALKFNEYVKPVALPKLHENIEGEVIVSGWGRTSVNPSKLPDRLQFLAMSVITNAECNERFKNLGNYPFPIGEGILCTLPYNLKQSGCHGDSGGPLVQSRGNQYVLVGVVNGGDGRCGETLKDKSPNVFARVSYHIDFIERYVDDLYYV